MSAAPHSRIELPPVPSSLAGAPVAAWREPVVIDTYEPLPPDRYPMFLERRVYQGSSGAVYPLPFHERISREKRARSWDAVHLENRWLRLMVLPELGGRIHVGHDKSAGYDFFYRNNVIKPALVGLAGPWISGGVELNWPQHHRPATFLPVDVHIQHHDVDREDGEDGAVTVWCSDHEPFHRMKGMHGVTLHPDRAVVELRVRLHNRSEDVRTFLWWANVAARVHDDYQSFFPPDVHVVADHARRAVTGFPRATQPYYGVDYPSRVTAQTPDGDRIDWYRNIPVPTSYMCTGSAGDFFGGYDHAARAGFVHWADHRIAPGKKQWTWGKAPFGRAWDRHLTDGDGPYVELMAGVFTDNQPDFSFLAPGETKAFSQYWYPFQRIGPVQAATTEVAVSLREDDDLRLDDDTRALRLGVAVTRVRPDVVVTLEGPGADVVWSRRAHLEPGGPLSTVVTVVPHVRVAELTVVVADAGGELLRWDVAGSQVAGAAVVRASEPPQPGDIASADELYLTGLHLAQYRHATRRPEPYWEEALRRDGSDARSATALAGRAYERAEFDRAEALLRKAIARLTMLNANPADGLAHYRLGLTLARLERVDEAYDTFAKAAWDVAWRAPAHVAMARLCLVAGRSVQALQLLDEARRLDGDHLAARDLRALALRRLGREDEARRQVRETLAIDPLDWWARDLAGDAPECDARTCLDIADEYAAAGAYEDALRLVDAACQGTPGAPSQRWTGIAPLALYRRAVLLDALGRSGDAAAARRAASEADRDWCFPCGLDDERVLRAALAADPADGTAAGLLGHWLYDRRRHEDAVVRWRQAARARPDDPVLHRNLAVAAFTLDGNAWQARRHLEHAMAAAPDDSRLLFERDQLAQRTGETPAARLARLRSRPDLVDRRDDLTIELAGLLVTSDEPDAAVECLSGRQFQPWEGGEGRALAVWERAQLRCAAARLGHGDPAGAQVCVRAALDPPESLGEAPHPLAGRAELFLALGDTLAAQGHDAEARSAWHTASDGDAAVPRQVNEQTFAQALARRRLGDEAAAVRLLETLRAAAEVRRRAPAVVDYFATSLPTMLLFAEDPATRQRVEGTFLAAQADAGLGDLDSARVRLLAVLTDDPGHAAATDLLRELGEPSFPGVLLGDGEAS